MELTHKEWLCPLSGIGRHPQEWGLCVVQCQLYDATVGECSLLGTFYRRRSIELREHIDENLETVAANSIYIGS